MSGKKSCFVELRERKQQLLVESELNRVQFLREWHGLKSEIRQAANPLRAAKFIASAATKTAATVSFFRRILFRRKIPIENNFWAANLISGARVGASLWALLRARRRRTNP